MSVSTRLLGWLIIVACSSSGDRARPQDESKPAPPVAPAPTPAIDDRYDSGALGAITFDLSEGTPDARAHFTRGLLALHSFWYDEAARQFQAAIDSDRTMNLAYWGAAMSRIKLLWSEDDVDGGRELLLKMPDPDRLTPREQAWIEASLELFRDGDVRLTRKKFAAAMEALHAKFPDDESSTVLALALLATTRPEDPDTLAVRKRAAALAIAVFERNPKHPGAAHYLIHAYDTPELAALALPYAREYAKIAPAAFHARHMPAHIFSRLGMWKEAIASCQSAWDASVAAAKREKLSANHHDFHSLSWLIEMNFELGHRKAADAAMAVFATAVRNGLDHRLRGLYATQVASYMARTADWARVDELLAPLDAPAADAHHAPANGGRVGEAATHCALPPATTPGKDLEQLFVLDARARAASSQRDVVKTKRYIAEMTAVREKMRPYLAKQPKQAVAMIEKTDARHRASLLARASGDDQSLLKALRESAVDGDQESGGESNPSAFLVHEQIGDVLLRIAQPKQAGVEYALALKKHPGRARSLLGAARAATRVGDSGAARASYQQLLQLWSAADEGTDGLKEARDAVAAGN